MHRCLLYLLVISLSGPPGLLAATSTVNPGSSIKDALGRMSGGDTLIIKGGTYREGALKPPSGNPGSPTVVKAAPGETVIVQPNNESIDTILEFQGTHDVVIDGLTLDADYKTAFPIYGSETSARITFQNGTIRKGRQSGALLNKGSDKWSFINNTIRENGTSCCATHRDDHGLYFSASNGVIRGNRFIKNKGFNIQIYSGSPDNAVIEGNLFTGSLLGVTFTNGRNHVFRNNVSVDDGGYYGPDGVLVYTSNVTLENNVIVRRNIHIVDNPGGITIKGNQICEGSIVGNASQSANRMSCDSLPALDVPPMAEGQPPVTPSTPEPPKPVEPPVTPEPPRPSTPPVVQVPQVMPAPQNFRVVTQP